MRNRFLDEFDQSQHQQCFFFFKLIWNYGTLWDIHDISTRIWECSTLAEAVQWVLTAGIIEDCYGLAATGTIQWSPRTVPWWLCKLYNYDNIWLYIISNCEIPQDVGFLFLNVRICPKVRDFPIDWIPVKAKRLWWEASPKVLKSPCFQKSHHNLTEPKCAPIEVLNHHKLQLNIVKYVINNIHITNI